MSAAKPAGARVAAGPLHQVSAVQAGCLESRRALPGSGHRVRSLGEEGGSIFEHGSRIGRGRTGGPGGSGSCQAGWPAP
jgi:hypothetical protein